MKGYFCQRLHGACMMVLVSVMFIKYTYTSIAKSKFTEAVINSVKECLLSTTEKNCHSQAMVLQ
jgi:hypothetical protein